VAVAGLQPLDGRTMARPPRGTAEVRDLQHHPPLRREVKACAPCPAQQQQVPSRSRPPTATWWTVRWPPPIIPKSVLLPQGSTGQVQAPKRRVGARLSGGLRVVAGAAMVQRASGCPYAYPPAPLGVNVPLTSLTKAPHPSARACLERAEARQE